MKIAPRTAEAFLAAPQGQCKAVLIYGPDQGLARERASRLRLSWLGESPDPFAMAEIEESRLLADPALLADELLAIQMMAPRRLVVLTGGDKLTGPVEEAMAHLHDGVFLVVLAGELGPRSSLRALFEKEPVLAALACYHDEARDLRDLLRKKLSEEHISASSEVMEYLAGQLGNDRGVTLREIEKISLYAMDNKTIGIEDARVLVEGNRETGSDDIVNAVADGDLAALETFLQAQLREGAQPVAYLRALQRYFNRLYLIQAQLAEGKSLDAVIASLKPKVFFRQEPILRRHVGLWPLPRLARALALLVKAELACKTSDLPPVPASSRRLMQVTQLR